MVISLTPLIVLDLEYFSENISTPSMLPTVSNHLCQTNLLLHASFQSYRLIFYKLIQQANSRDSDLWGDSREKAKPAQSSLPAPSPLYRRARESRPAGPAQLSPSRWCVTCLPASPAAPASASNLPVTQHLVPPASPVLDSHDQPFAQRCAEVPLQVLLCPAAPQQLASVSHCRSVPGGLLVKYERQTNLRVYNFQVSGMKMT